MKNKVLLILTGAIILALLAMREQLADWAAANLPAFTEAQAELQARQRLNSIVTEHIEQLNDRLPLKASSDLTFNAAIRESEHIIVYRFTSQQSDDVGVLRDGWRTSYARPLCLHHEIDYLLGHAVSLQFSIYSSAGVPIIALTLSENVCIEIRGAGNDSRWLANRYDRWLTAPEGPAAAKRASERNLSLAAIVAEDASLRAITAAQARHYRDETTRLERFIVLVLFCAGIASLTTLYLVRRPISRAWRRRSKPFRLWVFATTFWPLGVVIFALLADPYRADGLSDLEDSQFLHLLGVMFAPPLFFGAVWFGYKRFVD